MHGMEKGHRNCQMMVLSSKVGKYQRHAAPAQTSLPRLSWSDSCSLVAINMSETVHTSLPRHMRDLPGGHHGKVLLINETKSARLGKDDDRIVQRNPGFRASTFNRAYSIFLGAGLWPEMRTLLRRGKQSRDALRFV